MGKRGGVGEPRPTATSGLSLDAVLEGGEAADDGVGDEHERGQQADHADKAWLMKWILELRGDDVRHAARMEQRVPAVQTHEAAELDAEACESQGERGEEP